MQESTMVQELSKKKEYEIETNDDGEEILSAIPNDVCLERSGKNFLHFAVEFTATDIV